VANPSHFNDTKKRVFVRELSGEYSLKDKLQRLRGLGPGWQTRVNDALRAFVERMEDAESR